jgi:hypothetical protein
VALVRYDSERRIHGCAAAAMRMRVKGQNCDQVTCLYPTQLWEAMRTATPPIAETRLITTDRFRRADVRFNDAPEYTHFYETATPGGAWGMMTFRRVGAKANFEQLERQLDASTWNLPNGATAIGNGATLRLSPAATEFAEAIFSAWELMTTAATLIGGVDPMSVPVCAVGGDPVIEKVAADERETRRELELARMEHRSGRRHRDNILATIASQSDPRVLAAIEAALAKRKDSIPT